MRSVSGSSLHHVISFCPCDVHCCSCCSSAQAYQAFASGPHELQAMRAVLRRKASVHVVEKAVLLAAFAAVLRKRAVAPEDTVRTQQFQLAWKSLDVSVSAQQAVAIFNKYGQVLWVFLA